jgi:glutathione S-transferase
MTQVLPASRQRVFDLFTDAALLAQWRGPKGFGIPTIDFTPRVGAAYRIEMQPVEGDASI